MSDTDEIVVSVEESAAVEALQGDKELIDNQELLAAIRTYLDEELQFARNERTGAEAFWKRWRMQREGRPEEESKDFPWKNASNVRTPGMMGTAIIGTNTLEMRYDAKKPPWKVKPLDPAMGDAAHAMELMLGILTESPDRIDLGRKKHALLYDTCTLGKGFLKGHWEISEWNFMRESEAVRKTVHDGPQLSVVLLEDLLTRANVTDLQRAPWYAVSTYYSAHELQQRAQKGLFVNVEEVLGSQPDAMPANRRAALGAAGVAPDETNGDQAYTILEISLFWDVNGDGVEEDLRLFYHEESRFFLRAEYNDLSVRDVVPFDYYMLPFQFYGMGLSWMGDQTQEERDSLHNLAFNSLTLSSLQMLITKAGANIRIDEWVPMKSVEVDDPSNDIRQFQFRDNSMLALNMERQVESNLSVATGINAAMGGQPDQTMKSRFSPTGYAQQGQVGNAMLEANSKNIDRAFDQAGMLLVYIIVANGERSKAVLSPLLPPDLQDDFNKICDLNVEDIPTMFQFSVQSTRMDETQEAERQKYNILLQLHDQYGERVLRYVQLISQVSMQIAQQQQLASVFQPMLEAANKLLQARSKLTEQFLEFMGQLDASTLVTYWRDTAFQFEVIEAQKDAQLKEVEDAFKRQTGESANTGTVDGSAQEPTMEALPPAAGQPAQNGTQQSGQPRGGTGVPPAGQDTGV